MKKCSRCKELKELTEFDNHSARGKQSWCKTCKNEYRRESRRKEKESRPPKPSPKINDGISVKKCNSCEIEKPLTSFCKHNATKDGWFNICKDCINIRRQQLRNEDREKERKAGRKRYHDNGKGIMHSWKVKGIKDFTFDDYNQLNKELDGKCQICHKKPEKLVVDHDHNTGEVRGLLCSKCNLGLGIFDDNPALTASATKYLCKHII